MNTDRPQLHETSAHPGFASDKRPEVENVGSVPHRMAQNLFFCRYRQDKANLGLIEPSPLADHVMVTVEFRPLGPMAVFRDGRHIQRPMTKSGALALYDLRRSWVADLRDPFDNVSIFLPLSGFRDFAAERGQTFLELPFNVQDVHYDIVMQHLAQAILPALERSHEISKLYLDHIFLAARDHLAATYGAFSGVKVFALQSLTSRQLRNALDYIEANLTEDLSLAGISKACAASISSLTRGFKTAVGVSPHQWVLRRRIAFAQRLMYDSNKTLSDIAVSCGFADQSHLARVFVRHIGTSTAAWRRSIQR